MCGHVQAVYCWSSAVHECAAIMCATIQRFGRAKLEHFPTPLQTDSKNNKYLSKIYVIMQQRRKRSIPLNVLFIKGGCFEEFGLSLFVSCIIHRVSIRSFDAVSVSQTERRDIQLIGWVPTVDW